MIEAVVVSKNEAMETACRIAGGVGQLAKKMTAKSEQVLGERREFKQNQVSNWQRNGIPAGYVLLVSVAFEYELPPHKINRFMYPNPTDALPE